MCLCVRLWSVSCGKFLKCFYFKWYGILCNLKIVNCLQIQLVPYCYSQSTHHWKWHRTQQRSHIVYCTQNGNVLVESKSSEYIFFSINTFHFGFHASDQALSARQPNEPNRLFEIQAIQMCKILMFNSALSIK